MLVLTDGQRAGPVPRERRLPGRDHRSNTQFERLRHARNDFVRELDADDDCAADSRRTLHRSVTPDDDQGLSHLPYLSVTSTNTRRRTSVNCRGRRFQRRSWCTPRRTYSLTPTLVGCGRRTSEPGCRSPGRDMKVRRAAALELQLPRPDQRPRGGWRLRGPRNGLRRRPRRLPRLRVPGRRARRNSSKPRRSEFPYLIKAALCPMPRPVGNGCRSSHVESRANPSAT